MYDNMKEFRRNYLHCLVNPFNHSVTSMKHTASVQSSRETRDERLAPILEESKATNKQDSNKSVQPTMTD